MINLSDPTPCDAVSGRVVWLEAVAVPGVVKTCPSLMISPGRHGMADHREAGKPRFARNRENLSTGCPVSGSAAVVCQSVV
jgi:hypothetical protein